MSKNKFGKYDLELLQKARRLILEVCEYNDGQGKMPNEVKRLETIISKLDYLINLNAE